MATIPNVTLADGVVLPRLAFGVFQVPAAATEAAVLTALQVGYRAIDTAAVYGNEEGVGSALRKFGLPRDQVFVTTKLWNNDQGRESAKRALDLSLGKLGLDYVDLYLIHWPAAMRGLYVETWATLCELKSSGKLRSAGVSNFQPDNLDAIEKATGEKPSVNQIELHPIFREPELVACCRAKGIEAQAWSPLGRGQLLHEPFIVGLAGKYGRTPAQVILRWHMQRGHSVAVKASTRQRMAENLDIFDFEIEPADIEAFESLPTRRLGPDPLTFG